MNDKSQDNKRETKFGRGIERKNTENHKGGTDRTSEEHCDPERQLSKLEKFAAPAPTGARGQRS
jgi:hypothetical protein